MNNYKMELYTSSEDESKFIRFIFNNENVCNEYFNRMPEDMKALMISADDTSFSLNCSHLGTKEIMEVLKEITISD
jgi:hypothetical protein